MNDSKTLDDEDREILKVINTLKDTNLVSIASQVNLSKSAVQKRLKKLKNKGILKGFIPQLNPEKLPKQFTAISQIRAKYGPNYIQDAAKSISNIDGVCAVYFVLGDNDLIVILKASTRDELEIAVNNYTLIEGVERSNTFLCLSTEFEDISKFYKL